MKATGPAHRTRARAGLGRATKTDDIMPATGTAIADALSTIIAGTENTTAGIMSVTGTGMITTAIVIVTTTNTNPAPTQRN